MDRRTARAFGVALLVVLAVGVAAATLTTTLQSGDGFGSGGPGTPDGDTDPGSQDGNGSGRGGQLGGIGFLSDRFCFPVLETTAFQIGLLVVWVFTAAVMFWRLPRLVAVGLLSSVSILVLGLYAMFLGLCNQRTPESNLREFISELFRPNVDQVADTAQEGAEGAGGVISSNPWLSAAIVIVAVALLLALLYLHRSDQLGFGDGTGTGPDPDDLEAQYTTETLEMLGEVAGDAADRIDDSGDADNEVYRAWREMTTYVDVDHPDSSTPREFAAAATAAGMDSADVAELTELFEEVRYGGFPPTNEAEQRAIAALRRIEDTYTDQSEDQ